MARFEITLLGCGSATLTLRHAVSAQVVEVHDKLCLIDCGEGTQLQMRRMHVRFNRLNHIFISHLHGDHCFGLPGLIATLGMLGRKGELVIHGPQALENFLRPVLAVFCKELPYPVRLNLIDPRQHAVVMEDRSLCVRSIPLKHRIPTCGYLFVEKPSEPHLIRETADFYRIPVKERARIKQGADYVTPEGEVIPNSRLTRPADPPLRYAYCSDTAFAPEIVPWIEGCDCLYHEATFIEADLPRARETFHSTARQAAEIARRAQVKQLVIGHYSARYEDLEVLRVEAETVFPGTIVGMEGMKLSPSEKKQHPCTK
ncbi:MAG: ribonuclease Z [Tannerella sp.]|jgi:ribonuclease Z|nr:ribonuclease Z [Tannerella sp.]